MCLEFNYFYKFAVQLRKALVAELVDALDSKSSSFGSVGSIPTQGTFFLKEQDYLAYNDRWGYSSLKLKHIILI